MRRVSVPPSLPGRGKESILTRHRGQRAVPSLIPEKMWGPKDSTQQSLRMKTEIELTNLVPACWGSPSRRNRPTGKLKQGGLLRALPPLIQ